MPQSDTDLARRVATLEARDAVRAVIADYCDALDGGAGTDVLMQLFTEDAVLVNPAGEHAGRDAVARYYAAFAEGGTEFTRHYVANQRIDVREAGVARHRAYFVALIGRGGVSSIAMGFYDDTLIETPDGWKFRRKVNDITGMTTAARGWAHGITTQ